MFESVCIMTSPLLSAVYTLSVFSEDNAKFRFRFISVFILLAHRSIQKDLKRTVPFHGKQKIQGLCFSTM